MWIIIDVVGYILCLLIELVYLINGCNLLLLKGFKIYGFYGGGLIGKCVEVIWDCIIMLNGIDVVMFSFGIDGLGGVGYFGQYSVYWGSCIVLVLMISLIVDVFKYVVVEYGLELIMVVSNGFVVCFFYESVIVCIME